MADGTTFPPFQTIPDLAPASGLNFTDQVWINQAGVDRRCNLQDIANLTLPLTVTAWNGRTGPVQMTLLDVTNVGGAPISSPIFTNVPQAPTPPRGANDTRIATTQFVQDAIQTTVAGVASFNGRVGAVTLTTADITGAGGVTGGPFLPLTGGTVNGLTTINAPSALALQVGNQTGTVATPTRIQLDGSIGATAGGPLKIDFWGGGPNSYGVGLASNLLFFKGAAFSFYSVAGSDLADITPTGVNIPTGSAYRVNGVPLSSANLSDSVARTTFVPTVTFATPGDLTIAYTSQIGVYMRVGALILFYVSLGFTPTYTTATGTICISLPPIAPTDLFWAWPIRQLSGFTAWPTGVTTFVARNQTVGGVGACITLAGQGATIAGAQMTSTQLPSGTAVNVAFSGFYF